MKTAAGLAAVSLLMTQPSHPSPRDLLRDSRALTTAEIAVVLDASQRSMAGKTFRLMMNRPDEGPEILMGRDGKPRRIRWAGTIMSGVVGGVVSGANEIRPSTSTTQRTDYVTITDYTGEPAPNCSGSIDQGELVVEYRLESPSTVWRVNTRRPDARDFGGIGIAPIFKMLQGTITLASGELKQIGDRPARALTAVWAPPAPRSTESSVLIGDPIPNMRGEPMPPVANESVQSLWVDVRSLRPVRWELSERGLRSFSFDFKYSSMNLRLPVGVHPPDCLR